MKKSKISKVLIMKKLHSIILAAFLGALLISTGCDEDETEVKFTDESSLLISFSVF